MQVTLDTEFNATAGQVDVSLPGNAINVRKLNVSDHSETYSLSKGVMVDVSVSGEDSCSPGTRELHW